MSWPCTLKPVTPSLKDRLNKIHTETRNAPRERFLFIYTYSVYEGNTINGTFSSCKSVEEASLAVSMLKWNLL